MASPTRHQAESGPYNYPTAILTGKTPQQAALILPNSLNSATKLIDNQLSNWFAQYHAAIVQHNAAIARLLEDGRGFFTQNQYYGEYGNFPRTWNCLLTALDIENKGYATLLKNIKNDILGPLRDVVEKDVRLLELLINSQELEEIAGDLNNNGANNAEIQWNYKAPEIFQNFENFKTAETTLLLDIILNFFQFHNTKSSKDLENNENATNYLLNNFKLSLEMNNYLEYLLHADFEPVNEGYFKAQQRQQEKIQNQNLKHLQKHTKPSDNHSVFSGTSTTSDKKKSKLKSRVGSIFGRKKKPAKVSTPLNDTIPETESVTTTTSHPFGKQRTASLISRGNSRRSSDIYGASKQFQPPVPAKEAPQPVPKSAPVETAPSSAPQPVRQTFVSHLLAPEPVASSSAAFAPEPVQKQQPPPGFYTNPSTAATSAPPSTTPLTPQPNKALQQQQQQPLLDSPNVVKYRDSDSSSDEEPESTPVNGRRLSMLQRHDLGDNSELEPISPPVQPPLLDVSRSRQSSSGKYSFEAGDDDKPIQASPRAVLQPFDDPISRDGEPSEREEFPDPTVGESPIKLATTAPPPPPSRKVIHHELLAPVVQKNRRDIHSQMFHNLPSARESFIQPSVSTPTSSVPLVSQDTGNSLLKQHDFFKHFEHSRDVKGLNSSIAEVLNATFKDGRLVKSQIVGEIAFNYVAEDTVPGDIVVRIPNSFDKVILNPGFVEKIGEDEFKLVPAQILSKTLGAIKYLNKLNEAQVPVIIQQVWRFEDHQSSLMISLRANPAISQVVLNQLVISVALNTDIESTSASSKPQGSFNKDKNRITWRYTKAVALGGNAEEKVIARFLTNGRGSEHDSGVQLKFVLEPEQRTVIYEGANEVPVARSLISGAYSGHST